VPAETYPDDSIADDRRAINGEDPTDLYLIRLDGRPIGQLQCYRIGDHPDYGAQLSLDRAAIGIDLFIGEPELIGRGAVASVPPSSGPSSATRSRATPLTCA
jgi:aminoglycoside 6'-N-acetyltransferase